MTVADTVGTESLQEQAHRHLLMHFTRNGAFGPDGKPLLVLERGEGAYVFDTDGNRYFDGLSSLFCCQIGYSFGEEMAAVASGQMSTLAFNTNWATAHPPAIQLAAALAERAPGDLNRVFFTNGGSESVEAAWKIVRQHYLAKGEPQRTKAIAREIAYHGVTLGALSFTGVRPMKEPFGAAPIPVVRISNTNGYRDPDAEDPAALCARLLDEVERTIVEAGPETVAMLIAEPVQNAGGCLVPPDGYWPGLRALCDKYGIALVADEVITGFGRIGEWFASARYGVAPDLITCAKGITSAYAPMGAVLVSDRIAEPLYEEGRMLMHGITFAGHPVAAAIALRNIEIFEREGVLENVRSLEPVLGRAVGGHQVARADGRRRARRRVLLGAGARARRFGGAVLGRGAREAAARLPRRPAARGGADRPPGRPRRRRPAPGPAADLHPRGARGDVREDRGRAGRRLREASSKGDPHRARLLALRGRQRRPGAVALG